MKQYLLFNSVYFTSCLAGMLLEKHVAMGNIIYLLLFGMMCSIPLALKQPFVGRHVLLTLFLGYAFLAFGLLPYADLFFEFYTTALIPRKGMFTAGESMILLGIATFIAAYLLMLKLQGGKVSGFASRNWNLRLLPVIGLVCWVVGTAVTIQIAFKFGGNMEKLAEFGGFAGFILNARYFMMLGELIIAYHYIVSGKKTAGLLLLFIIIISIGIGLIVNSKEVGFRALAIYFVTSLMLKGKIPVKTLVAGFFIAAISFSIYAQYRDILGTRGLSTEAGFKNIGENIGEIASRTGDIEQTFYYGLNYLLSRLSLNGSTEMVVSRAGETVDFRNGDTLTPVIYAFVPRFIMPDKPSSGIGRLINEEFEVSWSAKTFISSGQLAEFYWNFGVPGVLAGMAFIGVLFAFISTKLDLGYAPTVTRLLMLLCTVYILILRFEGGFAQYYTVWMRLMVLIVVMHLFIPKQGLQTGRGVQQTRLNTVS